MKKQKCKTDTLQIHYCFSQPKDQFPSIIIANRKDDLFGYSSSSILLDSIFCYFKRVCIVMINSKKEFHINDMVVDNDFGFSFSSL